MAVEALGRGVELLADVDVESMPVRERLEALDALETVARRHAVTEWAHGGRTDIDDLAFGCGQHHPLIKPGSTETTRKHTDGATIHHPERLLGDGGDLAAG